MEEGETKIEALKREVREETGIENTIKTIEDVHYFEYVFGVEISPNENIVLDGKEHSQFKWCSFQEALELLKWDENKEALLRLNEILSAPK